jgi:hypothetical protein
LKQQNAEIHNLNITNNQLEGRLEQSQIFQAELRNEITKLNQSLAESLIKIKQKTAEATDWEKKYQEKNQQMQKLDA